jgi:hypothetical protein
MWAERDWRVEWRGEWGRTVRARVCFGEVERVDSQALRVERDMVPSVDLGERERVDKQVESVSCCFSLKEGEAAGLEATEPISLVVQLQLS